MTGSKKQVGDRGEALVVDWLRQQGWTIVAQQWHCRWGELDIVACQPQSCLAFVEVKTRRTGSLDHQGRFAITYHKQQKLWRSAEHFLHQYPQYQTLPCRFDVALVAYRRGPHSPTAQAPTTAAPESLSLVEYITDAFQLG